ncbi:MULTISPECIES: radical SAM protein [unclassified Streptomyces]|uniref:radical SAM protein n=1 Tax=unclassified Streptomyces TaxID=2593676 RepID=UPI00081E17C7|nr:MULTISPECIES: radical SAM protein [unclassified Streptomyces]MYR97521.1 radical SAM protein [Streptomyces sp. SID4937]SCE26640.1 radical SAM additional 4Fe4S-binding SPASM domain-containing protein [Streptomyces sp. ScaeMP-e83]
MAPTTLSALRFAWLEVTGLCQETCSHCYADSGPKGTHGTMAVADWLRVIDQLADMGTVDVQFIGGEPTLYYYSDTATEHDQVTGLRGSHRKTRANVRKALELGIPVRGGVVAVRSGQRVEEAARDLVALGVPQVGGDRTRAFGRAGQGSAPRINDLCGHCAHEKCAIGPTGDMWPCVLGRFLTMGNVKTTSVAEVWNGAQATRVTAGIAAVHGTGVQSCTPPQFLPMCGPCGPCVPSVGHCDPREANAETPAMGAPA